MTYLGIVALAKVQHKSIHITDIQQNMDMPATYNEYPSPEHITGGTKIKNSDDSMDKSFSGFL